MTAVDFFRGTYGVITATKYIQCKYRNLGIVLKKCEVMDTLSIYLRADLRHFVGAWLFYPSGTQ